MGVRSWWRARREQRRAIPVASIDSRIVPGPGMDVDQFPRGPRVPGTKTLVTMSPEATARWLGGGREEWTDHLVDPVTRMKIDQERREIKLGLSIAMAQGLNVDDTNDLVRVGLLLAESLPNSPATAKEVKELCGSVLKGAPKKAALRRKLFELAEFAYGKEDE